MKRNITAVISILFILFLMGCNFPKSTSSNPDAATMATNIPEPTPVIGAPTAIPSDLPTGYSDLLQEKIESGEWTLETGLVTMLRLFVGEIEVSDTNLGQGVLESEGTSILQIAEDYLQNGVDQTTKDEITRLIKILIPTLDTLDRYAIPEDQVSAYRSGLSAPVRQDPEECNRFWTNGFPDPRTPSFPCLMFNEQIIYGSTYKVFYPLAWSGDEERFKYYSAVMPAIIKSLAEYQNFGSLYSIYFVFTTLNSPQNFVAETGLLFTEAEACPVTIYEKAFREEPAAFQQHIAHEIFHCFQVWNLHDQFAGNARFSLWWLEGTAQYFSNLVYPFTDNEQNFLEPFSRLSTFKSITEMSYENYAFFQFLGNFPDGPIGVITMLRTYMTSLPDSNAQQTSLSNVPGMEATYEEFLRAVLDNNIMDSSESPIIFPVTYTATFTFTDIASIPFSAKPFVLARYLVTFDKEKSFAIETLSDGQGRSAARPENLVGAWGPIPADLGGCENQPYILYVITTAPGTERTDTISATNVDETQCDLCLIGRWEATNESFAAYMQSTNSSGSGTSMNVKSVSGVTFLEFLATGIGSGGYQNLKIHETNVGSVAGTEAIVTFDGSSSGPYSADGSTLLGLSGTSEIFVSVEVLLNGISLGSSTVPLRPEDFPVGAGIPTQYTCSGDTLTIFPPVEGITVEPVIYNRTNP